MMQLALKKEQAVMLGSGSGVCTNAPSRARTLRLTSSSDLEPDPHPRLKSSILPTSRGHPRPQI